MYMTMEADIRKGRVVPREPSQLPQNGRVLLVVLEPKADRGGWKAVRDRLGWLKVKTDPVAWQQRTRSEWGR